MEISTSEIIELKPMEGFNKNDSFEEKARKHRYIIQRGAGKKSQRKLSNVLKDVVSPPIASMEKDDNATTEPPVFTARSQQVSWAYANGYMKCIDCELIVFPVFDEMKQKKRCPMCRSWYLKAKPTSSKAKRKFNEFINIKRYPEENAEEESLYTAVRSVDQPVVISTEESSRFSA